MKFDMPFPNGHSKSIEKLIIRVDRNNPNSKIKYIVKGFDEAGIIELRKLITDEMKRYNNRKL